MTEAQQKVTVPEVVVFSVFIDMEKKNDSDGEPPGHSLWSQETEPISILSEENNLSLDISSPNALPIDPDYSEQSRSITTACSTPHESKLTLSCKRRFESLSEDLSPKKIKISTERLLSPVHLSAALSNSSNGTELTNGSDEIAINSNMKPVLTYVKKPNIIYSEANSSNSSNEQVSSKNSEFQTSYFTKAISPLRLSEQSRTLKQKEIEKEVVKETKLKHYTEEFVCSISYTVDESKNDITSLNIKEVNRHLCDTKNKLSLSSGGLADISGSGDSVTSGIEKFTLPLAAKLSVASTSSSSSVSSSSCCVANRPKHSYNKFLIPKVSIPKKHLNYRCKGSVCQCFCSKFFNCLLKLPCSPRCMTPEILSSSSENTKSYSQETVDRQPELISKPPPEEESISKPPLQEELKETVPKETNEEKKFPGNNHQICTYIPSCNNLPVFAKWHGNSWFYPGIVENADEETWHTSSHLEVKFFDGTVKKSHAGNLFPAYLLPIKTSIIYEKDGNSETKMITSVNRLRNNELLFKAELEEFIPFQKICFSSTHYKELLKENSSLLTPNKTPKFSISIANLQLGKRTRKLATTGDSSNSSEIRTRLTVSTAKKTTKGKRMRKRTDGSSTDQSTKTRKKMFRGSSQKKTIDEKIRETSTPHHGGDSENKDFARKLCLETPSCSFKPRRNSENIETPNYQTSTDADSSGSLPIILGDVSCSTLDVELIPDISRRHLRTKSSLKKQVAFHQKAKRKGLGPLPEVELFRKYNFIFTHSRKKPNPVQKPLEEQSYSEEGTDFEDYYETTVPFEHLWLREQIIAGGGKVFRSLLDIPLNEYSNTIVIADNIFETPNYLLAISLSIPIYRHDLIINCCTQNKHLTQMLNDAMRLPNGRSLDTGEWVLTSVRQPLKGYCCLLSLNVNNSTLYFWKKLIQNAGAMVISGEALQIISEQRSRISFIIGDAALPEEILNLADCYNIPAVSTVWLIQTIIHGKPKDYNSHPQFNVRYIPVQEDQD